MRKTFLPIKNKHLILSASGWFMILLLFFQTGKTQGQDTNVVSTRSAWIEKMDEQIAVDLSLNDAYETFEVRTPTSTVVLFPNSSTNLRVTLNYKFISFGVESAPDFFPSNRDQNTKGQTRSFSLGTGFIFRHWFGSAVYHKVRGYYLENTRDYLSTWKEGDAYIQFPDLIYRGISGTLGYSSNNNFSMRHVNSQTERQLRSAGSFMPAAFFRIYQIDDQSNSSTKQSSDNYEISIGPAYSYTYVFPKDFYITASLSSFIGYQETKLNTLSSGATFVSYQDNFIARWDARIGLGYNAKKYYAGIDGSLAGARYQQENTSVINHETRSYYHIFVGYRIDAPDFIQKPMSIIESWIP